MGRRCLALPPQDRIRELFLDAEHTLVRRVACGKATAGTFITGTSSAGYLRVRVDGVYYLVHRLLWVLRYGSIPDGSDVDHKDGDILNNSPGNLRLASYAQNAHNARLPSHNTSGVKGVSHHKASGKWLVQVNANGKHHYGGLHQDFQKACEAANNLRSRLHGEFARR